MSTEDVLRHAAPTMKSANVLRRAAPTMMSAEELSCSVCYELPPGEVHQGSRGHFLCVSCWNWMDEAVSGRKCPECRVLLPRANRNRVAELAIKHLPRPEGYTTPPSVRPNNYGDPLTPLLEGQVELELFLQEELEETRERLRIAEAEIDDLMAQKERVSRMEEAHATERARWRGLFDRQDALEAAANATAAAATDGLAKQAKIIADMKEEHKRQKERADLLEARLAAIENERPIAPVP